MDKAKKARLEAAGWRVGSASDFLELTPAEEIIVEVRLALSRALRERRQRKHWTQTVLANRLGSSQSRVAKMEAGDPSVSIDLLIHGLLAVGATTKDVGLALTAAGT